MSSVTEIKDTTCIAFRNTSEESKTEASGTLTGRIVKWIVWHNTYLPGISSLTGGIKAIFGVIYAVHGLAKIAFGVIGLLFSIILPMNQWYEKLRDRSILEIGRGALRFSIGIREAVRGAFSVIPGLGNGIILGCDALAGLAGKDKIADPLLQNYFSLTRDVIIAKYEGRSVRVDLNLYQS